MENEYNARGERLATRKIIKCPKCAWEYLPGEIFFPYNTVGYPTKEIRDPLGKIIYEEYKVDREPLAEEHFTCTNCNTPFIIEIDIKYNVKKEYTEKDFSSTTVSLW